MRPTSSLLTISVFLLCACYGFSQVNTNGTCGLSVTYPSLEEAIIALNAAVITAPVVIDLTADQTAPSGGYLLTVEGTALYPIVLNGNYYTITAAPDHIPGYFNDAIFKFVGADWVTLKKFTLQENPSVMNASDATNTVTEWGVALLASSLSNGSQHNTIQENIISLRVSATDRNTFGIYSSVAHGSNAISSGGNPTVFSGTNSFNKIYANHIYDVNAGISFIGSSNGGNFDSGNELGGNTAGQGNTITHFGKVTPSAVYLSNTITNYGIQAVNQVSESISNNTLVSDDVIALSSGVRGILKSNTTETTGTTTSTIQENTITLQYSASTGDMIGILCAGSAAASGVTLNISHNNIIKCKLTGGGSANHFKGITNSIPVANLNITDNLVRGLSSNQTSGVFSAYENTGAVVSSIHIDDNHIGNEEGSAVTFSAAVTGSCQVINNTNGGSSCSLSITGNEFFGITHLMPSAYGITFIENTAASIPTRNLNDNHFNLILLNTSSSVTFFRHAANLPANGVLSVSNNEIIGSFSKTGSAGDVKIFDPSTGHTAGAGATATISDNHFANLTFYGTSLFTGITYNLGSTCTISGNVFSNLDLGGTNVTSNSSINVSASSTLSIVENVINDIATPFAFSGISCASAGTSASIDHNQLDSINAGTAITGIGYIGAHSNATLHDNIIGQLTSVNGNVIALNCMVSSGTTTSEIYRNRISGIQSNHVSGTVSGIRIGKSAANPGPTTVYNNYVGDLKAPTSGVDNAVRGLEISSSNDPGDYKIYYNTININAVSTGVDFGASGIFLTSGASSIRTDVKNNIIVTSSTPNGTGLNVALRGFSFTASNYVRTSNHNLLYAGVPAAQRLICYTSPMNLDQTLASFQARVYPADNRSISQLPPFLSTSGLSPDFLHINPAISSPIENGGVAIDGIISDYDGIIRAGNIGYTGTGSLPDIGADEGNFTQLDIIGPKIEYTPISHTASLSNRTIDNIIITDVNGVQVTPGLKPKLFYKKKFQANTYNDNTNATDGWKYVEANGGTSPFSFNIDYALLNGGGVVVGDTVQYFIIAQDMAPTPNVSLNSGILTLHPPLILLHSSHFPLTNLINAYVIKAGIEGVKTVCASGCDYVSLTNAGGVFQAINTALVTNDLTIQIAGDLVGELGTHPLNAFPDTSTILIHPTGGVTRTISGAVPAGFPLIDLNGADHVTIDGLNTGGDSLTIINTSTSATAETSTIRFRNGASNNSILRCKVFGSSTVTIGSGGGNIYFNNSSSGSNNNEITDCDLGPAGTNLPNVLVYASNATSCVGNSINQSRLYNYFSNSKASSAIFLENASGSDWTLTDNKLYQTASRTIGAGSILHSCISITGGNGHTVSGNTIGYASATGTGTYTLIGVNGSIFIPINLSVGNATATEVQGNKISKISFTGPMSGLGASSPFIGMNISGGLINVGTTTGNMIGDSLTATNIVFGIASSTSISDIHGVYISGATSNVTFEHNAIAGIEATIGSSTGGTRIYGVRSVNDAILECRFNRLGSTTILTSIRSLAINNSSVYGIVHSSNTSATISGNVIRNLVSAATTGATSLIGIDITSTALQHVSNNKIFRLTSSASSGTGISNNVGIRISSSSTEGMVSTIEGNLIHSIVSFQNLDPVTGIHLISGNNTCTNNMVRLGRRVDLTNSITVACQIIGIHDEAVSGITKLFNNSIHISGNNVLSGSNITAAFKRSNNTICEVRNNIFSNGRWNVNGTGKHYVFSYAGGGISNTHNHNLYYNSGGLNNLFCVYAGTEASNFHAWKDLAQALNLNVDQLSDSENPFFILPDGNADNGDLHIQVDKNSDVESKGMPLAGILTDIDGEPRNNPPDVGADEGSFSSPIIIYTPLAATTSLANRTLSNVSITPVGAVNTSPGTKPRVYYKKKDDPNDATGWKYTETTSGSSPFSFVINYTQLNDGSASEYDTIQYFVVAQDTAMFPRVAMEDGFLNGFPFGVDLGESEFPVTGNINYYVIRKTLNGTKTICPSGCDYTSLTNDGGFFQEMNNGVTTGNVSVQILGDLLVETGTHSLNTFASGFALTIKPSGGVSRTISGAALEGKALIDFNGADSVTIDGLNTGGNALVISNTTISGTEGTSTITFRRDSRSCSVRNCTITGSSSAPGSGTIYISSEAISAGNDNIKLKKNIIGAAGVNTPANGIYLTGPSQENNSIVIDSNEIRDYFDPIGNSAGVLVSANCPGIVISNNRFYQTVPRTKTNFLSTRDCAVSSSSSCTVSNNTIGGSNNTNGGMYVFTGAMLSQLHPIYLAAPSTSSSTISGNVIKNITINGVMDGSSNSYPFVGVYHASGVAMISNNTIGDIASTGSITFTSTASNASTFLGIRSAALNNDLTTEGNLIGGITINEGASGPIHFTGISAEMTSTRKWICSNNEIGGSVVASIQINGSGGARLMNGLLSTGALSFLEENIIRNMSLNGVASGALSAINIQATGGHKILRNEIYGLRSANAGIYGMYLNFSANPVSIIDGNKVHSLIPGTQNATTTAIFINLGQVRVCNNMIRLGLDSDGLSIPVSASITGIDDATSGNTGGYYFNSIYIGGTVTGTANQHSIGFHSMSQSKDFRNNIIYNARSNATTGGKHYAYSLSDTIGLVSDHNLFFVTGTNGMLASIEGVDKTNMDAIRISTTHDENSHVVNPVFINPTGPAASFDLHINNALVSPAERNGISIPIITTDFDNQLRSANTPTDIGADACSAMSIDKIAPVISYSNLNADHVKTTRQVNNVLISDNASGINTTNGFKPRLYYKKSSDANTTTGWKFVEANGNTSPFDFTISYALLNSGSIVPGDIIQYFIVAADAAGTANIGKNKAIFNVTPLSVNLASPQFPITGMIHSYMIRDSISGIKTVCSSGCDFTSLTNDDSGGAFKAVNERALSGNVTLLIASDLTSETGLVSLEEFAIPFTVTIKPDGAPRVVTYSGSGTMIKLNGADRVVIDGSLNNTVNTMCPPSQASRDLTFRNFNSSVCVISLRNMTGNASTNNVIKNCIIEGNAASTTLFGIASSNQTVSNSSLGKDNDNNSFINNQISKVQYGIYSQGESRNNKNEGTIISLNEINLSSVNHTAIAGIYLGYEHIPQVTGNHVHHVSSNSTSAAGIALGILPSFNQVDFIGHDVTGALVSRNVIHDIMRQGDGSAFGITLASLLTSGSTANELSNNLLYKINTTGATTKDYIAGILIGGGSVGTTKIFHNSIRLKGVSAYSAPAFCLAVGTVNPSIELKNNILVNEMTSAIGKNYAIGLAYEGVYGNLNSNNNNLFTTSSPLAIVGGFDNSPSGDVANLVAFQNLTGKDLNSRSVLPAFVSETDLHLAEVEINFLNLDGKGTPVAVMDDIDCDVRNGVHPDIGADEIGGCQPTVFNTNNTGAGSMRAAIECAGDGDTLVFDLSILDPGDTIFITSGALIINKDIIIDQLPGQLVKIKTTGTHPIFQITNGSILNMKNAKLFLNGSSPNTNGRAVLNSGSLILSGIEIFEKSQNLSGSGSTIHNLPGSLVEIVASCQLKVQ